MDVQTFLLKDDGTFPNNEKLPVLYYPAALDLPGEEPAAEVEKIFQKNNWDGSWRNGVFDFHHYHSKSHEVMGIYSGEADLQLGGPNGVKLHVKKGDVLVIPAGVAHKRLDENNSFRCVGAYPEGQGNYDMNYGKEGERPQTDQNIAHVALPEADPVLGKEGPLKKKW